MNKKKLCMFGLIAVVLVLSACDPYKGAIRDGVRNLTVDIENSMFQEPDAANLLEQGPGVDVITVTFILDGVEVEKSLAAADLSAGKYTQIIQEVSGVLERVDVAATNAAGTSMAVSLDEKPDFDFFNGWETFANVQRFRIGCNSSSADAWKNSYLTLDIAPMGGASVRFKIDSGSTASMTTDYTPVLTTRQVVIEPVLSENPAGLSFDIYTAIVDKDLRVAYKPGYLNPDADYLYNTWKDVWSYEELTNTGRMISDTLYTMSKYNTGESLPFLEPMGTGVGYNSYLIDLTAGAESPIGKYLMIAVVSKYDVLSVPSIVDIIEIK